METSVVTSLFILVSEDRTYNLLVQRNYFHKQTTQLCLKICSAFCKYAANLQEETHAELKTISSGL